MTVKQLKEALEKYPDNMDVFMAERRTEFSFGLLNSISSKEITFSEDPEEMDEQPLAKVSVVVLDEF